MVSGGSDKTRRFQVARTTRMATSQAAGAFPGGAERAGWPAGGAAGQDDPARRSNAGQPAPER